MELNEYTTRAMALASNLGEREDMIHASLGIPSEAGEVCGIIKDTVAYGKPLDIPHLVEEIGDLCWFMTLMLRTAGVTWEHVFDANIAKLEARYPSGSFSQAAALKRDLDAEKAAMAAV